MSRVAWEAFYGLLPAQPTLILGPQSLADPTRAPAGKHTLWGYTHVPIEAHAPGFRDLSPGPPDLDTGRPGGRHSKVIGGDINGGSFAIDQQLLFCPGLDWWRWGTPLDGLYLASAAVPPAPELAWRHWEPPVCARTQGTEPENLDVDKMLEPGASPASDGYEGREAALQEIEAARGSGPVDPHPTDPAMPAWPPAQSGRGRPSG